MLGCRCIVVCCKQICVTGVTQHEVILTPKEESAPQAAASGPEPSCGFASHSGSDSATSTMKPKFEDDIYDKEMSN